MWPFIQDRRVCKKKKLNYCSSSSELLHIITPVVNPIVLKCEDFYGLVTLSERNNNTTWTRK